MFKLVKNVLPYPMGKLPLLLLCVVFCIEVLMSVTLKIFLQPMVSNIFSDILLFIERSNESNLSKVPPV